MNETETREFITPGEPLRPGGCDRSFRHDGEAAYCRHQAGHAGDHETEVGGWHYKWGADGATGTPLAELGHG